MSVFISQFHHRRQEKHYTLPTPEQLRLIIENIENYVEQNIGRFHANRLEKIKDLDFNSVVRRKNPYLYKAKNILTAQDLVKNLLDAYLQSQEETLFGDFVEDVAIFVCQEVFGGHKSGRLEGIDLEFVKEGVYYIVEIKSGPNWGNSSQIKRMRHNFQKAKVALQSDGNGMDIIAVNGCCYGIENNPNKGEYFKYCGQAFWEFVSDNKNLYVDIIEPFGYKAKEKNDEFLVEYARVINLFTSGFLQDFCENGIIDWRKIVAFGSKKSS